MKAINWAVALAMATGVGGCAIDEQGGAEPEASATEQAATTTDVWHGTWNGGSAQVSFWNGTGGGYLDVFENNAGQNRNAYLTFSRWSFDPNSLQCWSWTDWWGYTYSWCYYTKYSYAYGWGQIPTSDAQLTPGQARVHTTLPSTFGGYQCTIDYQNWIFECTSAAGGDVDVAWHKDGVYSTFHSGTDQQEYGPYSFKSQGTYRTTSARASGSLLGTAFDDAYGYFGDTKQTNVSKYVIQTPHP